MQSSAFEENTNQTHPIQVGYENKTGCFRSKGDHTTQYVGIVINQCKDPY